ncbi:MAG: molecular chaperone DnaJ [Pseudomonadota bacterium]
MMPLAALALGAVALIVLLVVLRAFATADIEQVKKAAAVGGAVLGVLVIVLLLATGRGGQVFWALALFGPALWRWWQGRRLARRFSRAAGDAADASRITTATLDLALDHGSGAMTGRVRRGEHAGRDLADLPLAALRVLLEDCAANDPESVPLLVAWLDRDHPDWRTAPPPAGDAPLSRTEALSILGLGDTADEAAIRAAHRRLMRAAHPDQGGSDWLAARLNAARDLLLGQAR